VNDRREKLRKKKPEKRSVTTCCDLLSGHGGSSMFRLPEVPGRFRSFWKGKEKKKKNGSGPGTQARCREHMVTPLAAPPAGKIEAQNDGTL